MIDFRFPLNAAAPLSRRRNSTYYRTLHRLPPPGMGLPISLESFILRLAPQSGISDFYRTFIFLRGKKCCSNSP
jgi:hypothetical protein